TNWSCTLGTLSCTRSDALAAAASFEPITVTVNVANNAGPNLVNTATVAGGGELVVNNDTSLDPTVVIQVADMTVTSAHAGPFVQGAVGLTYTLTVNNIGPGPTLGT